MSSHDDHGGKAAVTRLLKQMRLALDLYAAGSIATGVVDLIWGDFEPVNQPIQAFSDHIPGRQVLAYIAAAWLVLGGAAILWRNAARIAAGGLAAIYLIFGIFWLPRFYTAPHALGIHMPLIVSLIVGVAQQLILAAAAAIIYDFAEGGDPRRKSRLWAVVRWVIGLSSVDFGLAHLTGVPEVAAMVPEWMPLGGRFWAILTGLAFIAAGVAILSGVLDVIAARLLALMLFIFSVFVLAPGAVMHAPNHVSCGSNAYNLTAVGAIWIFAESLAMLRQQRRTAVDDEMIRRIPA
jgi:uncharacterized membrane protein YphA (DoxX/SURF4 family)